MPRIIEPITFDSKQSTSLTLRVGGVRALTLFVPTINQFKLELAQVIADAELRNDRSAEILVQANDTSPFWASILPLDAARTPATLLLLSLAQHLSLYVHMRFKHEFSCARPVDYSSQVQPMIRTPGHGTYPMGHMCESIVTAFLLAELTQPENNSNNMPAWNGLKEQLYRTARRIGENRVIAGLHFPIDWYAGLATGVWIAKYFEMRCKGSEFWNSESIGKFGGCEFKPEDIKIQDALNLTLLKPPATCISTQEKSEAPLQKIPELELIWSLAREEMQPVHQSYP